MPFESEKQRRFLWANKPEVARKFAEHKARGGRAKPDPKKAGTGTPRKALERLQGMNDLAYMVPGLSTAKFGADMIGDIEKGNYGDAATSAGMAALGLLPWGTMLPAAGKAAKGMLGWSDRADELYKRPTTRNKHVAEGKQQARHAPDTPRQTAGYVSDIEEMLAGRAKSMSPNDKVARGVNTKEGKKDFIQYETKDGDIRHFLADRGDVRTTVAGNKKIEEIDPSLPDTPWSWIDSSRGKKLKLTDKDYADSIAPPPVGQVVSKDSLRAQQAVNDINKELRRRKDNHKSKLSDDELMDLIDKYELNIDDFDFNKGGLVGPLGRK